MAITQICAEQVNTVTSTFASTITCPTPKFIPVGAGDECRMAVYNVALNTGTSPATLAFSFDVEFEYQYLNMGVTFNDYCVMDGQSGSITLTEGLGLCGCGLVPTFEYAYSCDAAAITTTPTMVQGPVTIAFTVTNLCAPTVFCVDTVSCTP